ncbi:Xylose operon regulatory protein [Lacunisphaera limnophila]|uniref:Xylose operon regulatory protein n=1 Tax=Lacunisphaera limnophila TaxID=1838286 RepID=A0A1D8ARS2_9BACT|nr:XylR family transcriptional regulator [Lacunisphaera limnophila]AOS43559.1 Xylose operon regulatory protein [Lacunisphaera limnophila]
MRPQVLLIFQTRFEECTAMLKGIAHFERSHQLWIGFLDDEARAEQDPQWLRSKRWDGVISRHTTAGLAQMCAELKLPLVDLNDSEPFAGVPKIRPDNVGLGHLGAEHFIERGYQHFGFAGFANNGWSRERRDGFTEALRLAGKTCDVFDVNYPGDYTPFWDTQQIDALVRWLTGLPRPVGIMACNDMRAQQVISAAHACDILVPEEVAVLGANNEPIRCELAYPPLSSVSPNAFQSGYKAAEVLAGLMNQQPPDSFDLRIEPVGVAVRPSTDVLAIDDRSVTTALSYIRQKACSGLSVDTVVKIAHASRSQLEKKFRRYLGRSPQAEIRRVQVAKIKQLLMETDYPLKRIADMTGFEHVEYMSVVFKRLTGDSPGGFRKRTQINRG